MRPILLLPALALLAASSLLAAPRPSARVQRGQAFVSVHCTACHAIGRDAEQSPNPEAPPFELIANQPGLTRATLATFLRDAHNYPAAMQFTVDRRAIDGIAAYMLTLRRKDYHPPI